MRMRMRMRMRLSGHYSRTRGAVLVRVRLVCALANTGISGWRQTADDYDERDDMVRHTLHTRRTTCKTVRLHCLRCAK